MVQTDENPFDGTDEIFEAKQPLKKDSFDPETIFHRDKEINLYVNALQDVVVGHEQTTSSSTDRRASGRRP
jgi:cell division control protein 6